MANIDIKRGRLTERIGDAEHNRLPNKNPKNATLASQVEEKREKLETLLKRVARSKRDLEKLEEDVTLLQHVKELHKLDKEQAVNTIDKHAEEKRNLRGENAQLRKQLKHLRNENATREKLLNEFEKKAIERESHHEKLKSKGSAQAVDLDEVNQSEAHVKLRNELKSEKDKNETIQKELEAKLKNLQAQLRKKSNKGPVTKEKVRSPKDEEIQHKVIASTSRSIKPETGQSRVHFGKPEDIDKLQEEMEKLTAEIDEKEKEWVAVQDQISKVETSRSALTAKHVAEHETLKHYQDRIDILELEPTPSEHRSVVNSHAATPKGSKDSKRSKSGPKDEQKTRTSGPSKDEEHSPKVSLETPVEATVIPRIGAFLSGGSKQKELHSRRSSVQETLQTELSQSRQTNAVVKAEVGQLEHRLSMLNQEKEHFTHEIASTQQRIQASRQKIEQIRHSHDTQRARLEEYANEKVKETQSSIQEINASSKSFDEELKAINEELKQSDEKIATLYQKLHQLQSYQKKRDGPDIFAINSELVDWRHRVRGAEAEFEALKELVKEAKQRNGKVKEDLAPVKPYFDEQAEYQKLREREQALNIELKNLREREKLKGSQ